MVITRITSGLGNQLFQYALARNLALRNNTSLYIDLSYYQQDYATDTPRRFKLNHFNTDYKVLNTSPYLYVSKSTKLLPNRTLKPLFDFVKEKQFHFDSDVLKSNASFITLDGFWQSERYFHDSADVIRNELTFKRESGKSFVAYKQEIEQADMPISVHIRRGDYVSHPEFSKTFGFVGLDYYKAALSLLLERFPTAKLFIFSDDPKWVKHNLPLALPHTLVTNTGSDADLDDLQLMSLCKHHIIANSSFSWWGAWLNPSRNKVVISPTRWFKDKPDWNTVDLIPSDWLRL